MKLTLPEKMFLLCYNVDRGRLAGRQFRGQMLRAAALTDLTLSRHLDDTGGRAVRTTSKPPADPFLAAVLADLLPDKQYSYRRLVSSGARSATGEVRAQLADKQVITVQEETVLGFIPRRDVTPADPTLVERLQTTARDAVLGDRTAETVDVEDAALAVLAAVAEVRTVFRGMERIQHRARIRELEDHLGSAVPALRSVVRGIKAAHAAAASGGGG